MASIAIHESSTTPSLFTNLSDDENGYTPTCLMAKGAKVISDSPPPTDDNDEIELKEKMIKDFGIEGYRIITKLTEKLERKKMTLVD